MQKEFGIEAVPGFIHLPDNTDIPQFLSWKDNDREEFYNKLKKNPNAYATAPANPEMFAEAFKKYARLGYDMLVLTMSSAMSGTYEFALKGREQALQEFPDTKIHAIDTLRFGPGCGLMAVRAAQLRDMGKSLDEVLELFAPVEAENAKLQERVEWLDGECRKSMGASHKFFEMVGEYQKENAKLRELVTDLALDYLYSCGYHTQRHDGFPRHTCAEYEGLLDEIGIEVENV
jgi:hypothetical protein